MPTYDPLPRFLKDWKKLTAAEQAAVYAMVEKFIHDLEAGEIRKGLRVTRVQGTNDIWEITWADDGRATFQYGTEKTPGDPHIIWRRVGGHEIFANP